LSLVPKDTAFFPTVQLFFNLFFVRVVSLFSRSVSQISFPNGLRIGSPNGLLVGFPNGSPIGFVIGLLNGLQIGFPIGFVEGFLGVFKRF